MTLAKGISGPQAFAVGLTWWLFRMALAVADVVFVHMRFRGKVELQSEVHRRG
jgi:hypothetical protein